MAFGLIKYNGFQISEKNGMKNIFNAIIEKKLTNRNWLYTIFIRKTNLKLHLLNFNIFGSSEHEKMDIFLKTFKFFFVQKTF